MSEVLAPFLSKSGTSLLMRNDGVRSFESDVELDAYGPNRTLTSGQSAAVQLS